MAKKSRPSMRRRLVIVAAFLGIVLFIVCAGRLFYLQVVKYDEYQQMAIDQQTTDESIKAIRGTIYDRNMKPLAISAGTEMVTLEAIKIDDEEQGLLIARTLSEILDMDYDEVLAKVEAKSTYTVVKRRVEKDVADKVRQFVSDNGLDSIYMADDTTRYYPYGNFLSHTLGFVGSEGQGLYGLEAYYDDVLNGTDGRVIKAINAKGGEMPFDYEMYYDAQDGGNLVLTVDEVIQHYLEKNLEMAYADNQVRDHVTGIVMDVNTGAILGMANKPDFNLNDPFTIVNAEKSAEVEAIENEEERNKARSDVLTSQWLNNAVTYAYYPGSTFKIVTASSALEEAAVDTSFNYYCSGVRQVSDWSIRCWKPGGHGQEDLIHAVMNSCNPAFMEIGSRLGIDNFYKYFRAFGLREPTGVDLPGESSGSFWDIDTMNEVDLAVASFGQNFEITPLQLITAVSAVANGGYLVTPHLVDRITDAEGNTISKTDTTVVRQVISKETSQLMRDILQQVVSDGTGKNAYLAGYRVAGKTGTSEKIAKQNQTGEENLFISSFIAFAPADDPQVAVLVLLDEPTVYPYTGGITVAPVVRRIMEEVLPYLGIEPIYTEEEETKMDTVVPDFSGMTVEEAKLAAEDAGISIRIVGSGETVQSQVPAFSSTISRQCQATVYMDQDVPADLVTVPDLLHLGVAAARQRLSQLGLFYRSSGTEYATGNIAVQRQDIAANTEVPYGTILSIEFSDLNQTSQ